MQLQEARELSFLKAEEALETSTRLIVECRQKGFRELELIAIGNLAVHQSDLGNWQKALTYTSLGIRLGRDAKDSKIVFSNLCLQTLLQFRTLKWSDCFESAMVAKRMLKSQSDPQSRFELIDLYASMFGIMGDELFGCELGEKAIEVADANGLTFHSKLAHSHVSILLSWHAQKNSVSDEILSRITNHVRLSQPSEGEIESSMSSFFYSCAQFEHFRTKGEHSKCVHHAEIIAKYAPFCGQRSNLHFYKIKIAEMHESLGDLESAFASFAEFNAALQVPVSRSLLVRSLHKAVRFSERHDLESQRHEYSLQLVSAEARLKRAQEMSRLAYIQLRNNALQFLSETND